MSMTRRTLVKTGSATGAVIVLGGAGRAVSPALAVVTDAYLRRGSYVSLVGSTFTVVGAGGVRVPVRLTEVADLARAASEPKYAGHDDVFALTFTGARAAVLSQGTHTLTHPTLGTFSLFLVPVGGGSGDQQYEVVVDRSVRLADAQDDAPEPLAQTNASSPPAQAPTSPPAEASVGAERPASKKPPKRKPRKVLRAGLARRGGLVSCDVRVAKGQGLVAVSVAVLRGETVVARGSRRLRGRYGVRVDMRMGRRLAPGDYVVRVTTTDKRGRRATTRLRATLSS